MFDPVFASNPRESFVAETPRIFASTTRFPPPINLTAEGDFELAPVPEPGTMTLVGLGLAGLVRRFWKRSDVTAARRSAGGAR